MGASQARDARFALLGGLLVTGVCLARVWYLAERPELAITAVPDDAFYYLKLAQNRVATGAWTFDGTALTSGFHVLHAYLLALVYLVLGSPSLDWVSMLRIVGAFASLCMGVAAALVVWAGRRSYGAVGWVLVVFLSPPVVLLSSLLMEAHLVVLGAAAVLLVVSKASRPGPTATAGIVMIGFVASLSRSDFVLFPGLIWLATLVYRRTEPVGRLRRAGAVFLGSVAGFLATLVHSLLTTGALLQTSVRTKLRWSGAYRSLLADLVGPAYILVFLLVLGFAVVVVRRRGMPRLLAEPVTLACLLAVVAYSGLYSAAGQGVQVWYTASLVVPVAFVFVAVGSLVPTKVARLAIPVLAVCGLVASGAQLERQLWPWQRGVLHAAERLRDDGSIRHFGSWNAGILAVVSGAVVTNLDGLVDDRAAAAGARGDVLGYVRERGIVYLVDHPEALTNPQSGEAGDLLVECTKAVAALSNPDDPVFDSGPVTLFRVRSGCG
jgi:hypothetical protein